jgi:hypothetical protein
LIHITLLQKLRFMLQRDKPVNWLYVYGGRGAMIMTYTLTNNDNIIVRDEDNAFIPTDEGNRDYRDYLKWVDEGNTPNPAPVEITPPIQENVPTISELADQIYEQEARITALEESVSKLHNPLLDTKSQSGNHPRSKK